MTAFFHLLFTPAPLRLHFRLSLTSVWRWCCSICSIGSFSLSEKYFVGTVAVIDLCGLMLIQKAIQLAGSGLFQGTSALLAPDLSTSVYGTTFAQHSNTPILSLSVELGHLVFYTPIISLCRPSGHPLLEDELRCAAKKTLVHTPML